MFNVKEKVVVKITLAAKVLRAKGTTLDETKMTACP